MTVMMFIDPATEPRGLSPAEEVALWRRGGLEPGWRLWATRRLRARLGKAFSDAEIDEEIAELQQEYGDRPAAPPVDAMAEDEVPY